MNKNDLVKCEDMRIHAERAIKFIGLYSLEEFLSDELTQAAIIRNIEVIGEAARKVSNSSRSRAPNILWTLIIGMRHVLAHDYGAVNLDRIYEAVKEHLPSLLENLQDLIDCLEKELGWDDKNIKNL